MENISNIEQIWKTLFENDVAQNAVLRSNSNSSMVSRFEKTGRTEQKLVNNRLVTVAEREEHLLYVEKTLPDLHNKLQATAKTVKEPAKTEKHSYTESIGTVNNFLLDTARNKQERQTGLEIGSETNTLCNCVTQVRRPKSCNRCVNTYKTASKTELQLLYYNTNGERKETTVTVNGRNVEIYREKTETTRNGETFTHTRHFLSMQKALEKEALQNRENLYIDCYSQAWREPVERNIQDLSFQNVLEGFQSFIAEKADETEYPYMVGDPSALQTQDAKGRVLVQKAHVYEEENLDALYTRLLQRSREIEEEINREEKGWKIDVVIEPLKSREGIRNIQASLELQHPNLLTESVELVTVTGLDVHRNLPTLLSRAERILPVVLLEHVKPYYR